MACKVHRVRHYNPKPKSINSLSFNKVSRSLAVSRDDASIEIWDLSHAPLLVKFIPGVKDGSIEAVCWVNNRLLSTGLGGSLVEWDLDKLTPKRTVLLTGYAAWCLDVNSTATAVAVGTEQGYINIFSTSDNDIIYQKLFDKQEGRIICCKFNQTGNTLVTGSINTIRVWDVATGQAISRMSTKRRGKETIVWSLGILSDNTIISGESGGRLSFWDATSGDQIETFITHKADILSIAVSEKEDMLYCGGVDPVIVSFAKVPTKKSSSSGCLWAKHLQRQIHEHDVRCLTLNGEILVSAGVDGYLTFSSYPPKWVMRIPPSLPEPHSSVCVKKKLLLLRYNDYIEVWKLGTYALNEKGKPVLKNTENKQNQLTNGEGAHSNSIEADSSLASDSKATLAKQHNIDLKLDENALKLVAVKTKGGKPLRCCALSPNGKYIIYSTDSHIRMLKLDTDDSGNVSLSKMTITGLKASFCDRVTFTPDSRFLVLHSEGAICMFQVDQSAGATIIQTISTNKYLKSPTLLHLMIFESTPTYMVAADCSGSIAAWTRGSGYKFEHHALLPHYQCLPSALTLDTLRNVLIVAYVDQKIIEYDLKQKRIVESLSSKLPPEWYSRRSAVTGVSCHPNKPLCYIFHDYTSMWILEAQELNKGQKEVSQPPSKRKPEGFSKGNASLRIVPVKYLAGFHWLGSDEAVIVETLPENIVAQLPDVISRKRPPQL